MPYLLDTDVISALIAGTHQGKGRKVADWLRSLNDEVFLSSVSVSEITRGIARMGGSTAAPKIQGALEQILTIYDDHVLTPTHDDWRTFGNLTTINDLKKLWTGKNQKNNQRTGADIFLAIQAQALGYTMTTCNAADFQLIHQYHPLDAGVWNPATREWICEPKQEPEPEPEPGPRFRLL